MDAAANTFKVTGSASAVSSAAESPAAGASSVFDAPQPDRDTAIAPTNKPAINFFFIIYFSLLAPFIIVIFFKE